MTRAEAAAQAARALSDMMVVASIINDDRFLRHHNDYLQQSRAAEVQLAAALLVLTEPAVSPFVDPFAGPGPPTHAVWIASCCGKGFPTLEAWLLHRLVPCSTGGA